jgi:sterol desaturase/sphingolipid hydroxylase (fatty acid hydroxylase superfamily)
VTTRNLKHFTPILFYAGLVALLFPAALAFQRPSTRGMLVLTVSGFLSWQLLEYVLHRFVFHLDARSEPLRRLVYHAHLAHHENPKAVDNFFASLWLSVPIASLYFLFAWLLLGKWETTVYLWSGLVAGYLVYEYVHYQAHHGRPRAALFRYLKKYHLLHHHRTPDLRFGVTSPAIDYLFGTYRPASR